MVKVMVLTMSGCSAAKHVVKTPPSQMPRRLTCETPALRANLLDAVMQIAVDIIVQRQPPIRARGISPIHDIKIDAQLQQVLDQRTVFLQVRHRPAADQSVDDQHRGTHGALRHRAEMMQGHFVLLPDKVLRRGGDRDVSVTDLIEQPRAGQDTAAEMRHLGDSGRRADRRAGFLRGHPSVPRLARRRFPPR